ncbi:hypothetical protein ANCDUO_06124 [Ancylostoma duodenale]|uniref:CHK kinase-like domain-containing protein n=1 Tax=Ancylostoma duodenale TaxID=51022 RepID=A0A0C2GWX9_9BILA|nr:hypothetical protein ANCDUO_06124 [Ancylostoma duodenale]
MNISTHLPFTNPKRSREGKTSTRAPAKNTRSGQQYYRVHLVKDEPEEDTKLPEAAKLAAFFNSKFFHETVTGNQLAIPCGRFERSFRIDDADVSYLVFVIKFEKGWRAHQLSEEELCLVAEKIGAIHAINTASMQSEFLRVIGENHENIRRYQASIEPHLLKIMQEAVEGELAQYFSLPHEVMERLETVVNSEDESDWSPPTERVICHGRLTSDNCFFQQNSDNGGSSGYKVNLVDINEWENVHFGDVAFDLSNLIISSAEPSVRRNKYMTIFRSYYYSRVDQRTTDFRLSDLKRLFRKHHKQAVILGIEPLLEMLTSSEYEDVKRAHSYRWESALEDAFDFATHDYISDEEHCLFAK